MAHPAPPDPDALAAIAPAPVPAPEPARVPAPEVIFLSFYFPFFLGLQLTFCRNHVYVDVPSVCNYFCGCLVYFIELYCAGAFGVRYAAYGWVCGSFIGTL